MFSRALSLSLCSIAIIACKSRTFNSERGSDASEFKPLASIEDKKQSLSLTLPNLAKAVPGLKVAAVLETLQTDAHRATNIKVWLGKLTQEQCKKVASIYADGWKPGLSGVNCETDADKRGFFLEDFTTPVMQALYRTTFVTESEESKPSPALYEGTYLETNCWSTAYEVGRRQSGANPQYSVHVVHPTDADKIWTSTTYTRLRTGPAKPAQVKEALDKWGTKFGDILIIRNVDDYGDRYMQHAAVFVDGGLLFEKVGTDTGYPHRFVSYADIANDYDGSNVTYEVRSVVKDFPHVGSIPGVQFRTSIDSEGSTYKAEILVRDLNLNKVAGQKYALPPAAFKPLR